MFNPGIYTDRTNGDMWRCRIVDGWEAWTWINGNRWRFVPRDNLGFYRPLPDWMLND